MTFPSFFFFSFFKMYSNIATCELFVALTRKKLLRFKRASNRPNGYTYIYIIQISSNPIWIQIAYMIQLYNVNKYRHRNRSPSLVRALVLSPPLPASKYYDSYSRYFYLKASFVCVCVLMFRCLIITFQSKPFSELVRNLKTYRIRELKLNLIVIGFKF